LMTFYYPEKSHHQNFFQRHFPYVFPHEDD